MRLTNFDVEAECAPSRSAIMTGRFSIRSGTQSVPIGGDFDGFTRGERPSPKSFPHPATLPAPFGKWHLGSVQGRLPNDRGFDEWYDPAHDGRSLLAGDPQAKAAGVPPMHVM
jgi:hypothetical protein